MFKNLLYQKLMRRIFKAYLSVKFGVKEFEIEDDAKCLCLCPHQDDESIGMGGTHWKHLLPLSSCTVWMMPYASISRT